MHKKSTEKRKMISDVVHDVRGKLSVIKIQNELMSISSELSLEMKDTLKNNIKEVDEASKIVGKLLK